MRIARAFAEAARDRHETILFRSARQPRFELRLLFERADGGPERAVDRVALFGLERIGRVLMSDMTLIAQDAVLPHFPQRAAAIGAGDRRGRAEAFLHLGDFRLLRRELRLEIDTPEGEVNLSVTQFQAGDYVDVTGRSKGKGFQGVMKKHNFHGQGAAHGSKTHRRNGAIGNRSTPGRIWKNMGMPGHLGDERVTVQNLQVMQVREAEKIILVSGAVPGSNGSYLMVRPALKKPAAVKK